MRWHEVTVHTTEEAAEIIASYLHDIGAGGVSIEESGSLERTRDTSLGQLYDQPLNDIPDGRAILKAYFAEGLDMEAIISDLEIMLSDLKLNMDGLGTYKITKQNVDDEDWAHAWKQYFKPLRISERLTIKPSWEDYTASPEEIILELDPGMAFGTGTHATTALCLRALDQYIQYGDDVIDVGTGSGILAIAAVKLGAAHVLAIDLDSVAVTIAKENALLNNLQAGITIMESDLLQVLKERTTLSPSFGVTFPVRVVVANILAEIIVLFVDDVFQALQSGGVYITSGIILRKEHMVVQALEAAGFHMHERNQEGDWVVLVARKP